MAKSWIQIDILCRAETAEDLGAELSERFGAGIQFIAGGLRIYFAFGSFEEKRRDFEGIIERFSNVCPDCGKIEWSSTEIPDEDWSQTWKAHFKPLHVGRRFLIAPTWEAVEPGPDDLLIRIDPGMAFGTGHHETTRLCLEWLEAWAEKVADRAGSKPPGSLLDVGTGSGILAMGAALLGFENIVGVDNDPEAIEVAIQNVSLNKLTQEIRILCASPGDISSEFNVVISNIQSLPLIGMSETLISRTANEGRLVLSGILAEQAEQVRSEYQRRGAEFAGSRAAGEWVLLEFVVNKDI